MKIGDLVSYMVMRPGYPRRIGIITGSYRNMRTDSVAAFTVQFFDGKKPETNSFRPNALELISEGR